MTETIEVQPGTCQTITIPANDHAVNGHLLSSIAGPSAAPAEVLPTPSAVPSVSLDLCCRAIGLAVAGAAVGHSTRLQTPNGLLLNAGFNLIIAAADPTPALTALAHILAPLKDEQARRHRALASLDREGHQRKLAEVRAECAGHLEVDILPDPAYTAFYADQANELENALRPMLLLENPPPGRLTLAIQKSADACVLGIYDDLALRSLLDSARGARASLDWELLSKSWHQQAFDGGFLEGVHDAAIVAPLTFAVIVAHPESAAKLLMSDAPLVKRFADTCLVVSDADIVPAAPSASLASQKGFWRQTVSRLLAAQQEGTRPVEMNTKAIAVMDAFRERAAVGIREMPGDQSRYLTHLPALACKIALALWGADGGASGCVTWAHASRAVEIVELSSRSRQMMLQSSVPGMENTAFERLRDATLRKITTFGPLSRRSLCHHFHSVRIGTLMPVLDDLVQAKEIVRDQGGRYTAATPAQLQIAAA